MDKWSFPLECQAMSPGFDNSRWEQSYGSSQIGLTRLYRSHILDHRSRARVPMPVGRHTPYFSDYMSRQRVQVPVETHTPCISDYMSLHSVRVPMESHNARISHYMSEQRIELPVKRGNVHFAYQNSGQRMGLPMERGNITTGYVTRGPSVGFPVERGKTHTWSTGNTSSVGLPVERENVGYVDHVCTQRVGLPVERETVGHVDRVGEQKVEFPMEREDAQGPQEKVIEVDDNHRVRALRSFKFALVEYIKDLLKPYWRDGTISKDAYKVIVKKSVIKVIKSLESSDIPSGRMINDYLSCSHSKLSKLVQVYAQIYRKG